MSSVVGHSNDSFQSLALLPAGSCNLENVSSHVASVAVMLHFFSPLVDLVGRARMMGEWCVHTQAVG